MKKKSIFLRILYVCLALIAGLWGGMKLEEMRADRLAEADQGPGTVVAVVNQDLGVKTDGTVTNYANAVIETLGDGYTVVSQAIAENGMADGEYGAILSFPPEFSENVMSINDNSPAQAHMQVTMNPNLTEEQYVPLYNQLTQLEKGVRDNLAHTYVETVYEQLHEAQDEVKELLNNDDTDMEAVRTVVLTNYTELLDLGDMPQAAIEFTSADCSPQVAASEDIGNEMQQVYVDSYAKAQEDYAEVKEKVVGYENTIKTSGSSWTGGVNSFAKEIETYAGNITDYKNDLLAWYGKSSEFKTESETYVAALETFVKEYTDYQEEKSEHNSAYKDSLKNWGTDVQSTLNTAKDTIDQISGKIGTICSYADTVAANVQTYNDAVASLEVWQTAWETYFQQYAEYQAGTLTDEPVQPTDTLPAELQSISADIPKEKADVDNALSELKSTLDTKIRAMPSRNDDTKTKPTLDEKLPTVPSAVPVYAEYEPESFQAPSKPEELTQALGDIQTVSGSFNPEDYLNEQTKSEADQCAAKFYSNLQAAFGTTTANDAANLAQLTAAYSEYNTYIGELRTSVYETHEREQSNLATSISGLSTALEETSRDNHERLDTFAGIMPNSRINSTVNQAVVTATVTPVTAAYDYTRAEPVEVKNRYMTYLPIVFGVVAVLLIIGELLAHRRKKEKKRVW